MSEIKEYSELHQCGLLEATKAVKLAGDVDAWTTLSLRAIYARDLNDVKGVLLEVIQKRLEELNSK